MREAPFSSDFVERGRELRASLIVCTRNRCGSLQLTLDSITAAVSAAPGLPLELILVDNGSTDATAEVCRSFADSASFPVVLIHEPAPGLSNARNSGVRAARGEIIAFTDDDCQLATDFFTSLLAQFDSPAGADILGGRVLLGDPTDAPFTIKPVDEPEVLDERGHPGGIVLGCNMAVRRGVFEAIGLFDPRFGAGAPFRASEESDLIYRAFRAGFRVEYRPNPTVKHFHGRKSLEEIRRLSYGYFVGTGAMYAKHRFGGRWLSGHLLRNTKSAIGELLGRRAFLEELKISHFDLLRGNIEGMFLYWTYGWGRARMNRA